MTVDTRPTAGLHDAQPRFDSTGDEQWWRATCRACSWYGPKRWCQKSGRADAEWHAAYPDLAHPRWAEGTQHGIG